MRKTFWLLKQELLSKKSSTVLIGIEITVAVFIMLIMFGHLLPDIKNIELASTEKELGVIGIDSKEQIAYALNNNISLYKIGYYTVKVSHKKTNSNGNSGGGIYLKADILSADFYEKYSLDMKKGTWFEGDFKEYDAVAVVTSALEWKFPLGSEFDINGVRAFVCGVTKYDSVLSVTDDYSPFIDSSSYGTLYISDISGKLLNDKNTDFRDYYYAFFEDDMTPERKQLGIVTLKDRQEHIGTVYYGKIADQGILAVVLFVLFTVAYIGEKYLTFEEREKAYVIWLLCGGTKRKIIFMQIAEELILMVIPYAIAVIASFALKTTVPLGLLILPLIYLMILSSTIIVSTVILSDRKSIITRIKRGKV